MSNDQGNKDDWLGDLYQSAPAATPPADLDQQILDMAHAAQPSAQQSASGRSVPGRWYWMTGSAAAAVLMVAVTLSPSGTPPSGPPATDPDANPAMINNNPETTAARASAGAHRDAQSRRAAVDPTFTFDDLPPARPYTPNVNPTVFDPMADTPGATESTGVAQTATQQATATPVPGNPQWQCGQSGAPLQYCATTDGRLLLRAQQCEQILGLPAQTAVVTQGNNELRVNVPGQPDTLRITCSSTGWVIDPPLAKAADHQQPMR